MMTLYSIYCRFGFSQKPTQPNTALDLPIYTSSRARFNSHASRTMATMVIGPCMQLSFTTKFLLFFFPWLEGVDCWLFGLRCD